MAPVFAHHFRLGHGQVKKKPRKYCSKYGKNGFFSLKMIDFQYNSTYIVPKGSQTFDDFWSKLWGGAIAALGCFAAVMGTIIISHSNHILKMSTVSNMTKTMHKEAMRTLIVQVQSKKISLHP